MFSASVFYVNFDSCEVFGGTRPEEIEKGLAFTFAFILLAPNSYWIHTGEMVNTLLEGVDICEVDRTVVANYFDAI